MFAYLSLAYFSENVVVLHVVFEISEVVLFDFIILNINTYMQNDFISITLCILSHR